jgi:hypothetical protein
MKECIRCGVISEMESCLCLKCIKLVNCQDLDSQRTDQIVWGLQILRHHGVTECNAVHDEFYAGLQSNKRLPEADHEIMTTGHGDGLNWHWNKEFDCYGFFT